MAPLPDYVNEAGLPSWHPEHPQPLPRELQPIAAAATPATEPEPDQGASAAPAGTVTIEELRRRCLRQGLSAAGDRQAMTGRLQAAGTPGEVPE